jgi:hypothetical protein
MSPASPQSAQCITVNSSDSYKFIRRHHLPRETIALTLALLLETPNCLYVTPKCCTHEAISPFCITRLRRQPAIDAILASGEFVPISLSPSHSSSLSDNQSGERLLIDLPHQCDRQRPCGRCTDENFKCTFEKIHKSRGPIDRHVISPFPTSRDWKLILS